MAEPRPGSGLKDVVQRNKGIKMADKAQWRMNKMAKVGGGRGLGGVGGSRLRGGAVVAEVTGLSSIHASHCQSKRMEDGWFGSL